MKTRRMVSLAFFIALAIALHYVESFIPTLLPIPGFRLGLSNIVSLFVLYYYGGFSFIFVVVVRVLLVALISTGFGPSFFMSVGGSLSSILISLLLFYVVKSSIYSLSVSSALFHSIGQLIAYAIFFSTPYIFVYLTILGPLSMLTGYLMALLVKILIKRLPSFFRVEERKRRT
ncbi:MAG: Gx transporter family protein [Bacilli bacterium]